MPEPVRAALYVRLAREDTPGLPTAQHTDLRAALQALGWHVVAIYPATVPDTAPADLDRSHSQGTRAVPHQSYTPRHAATPKPARRFTLRRRRSRPGRRRQS